jgi:excisionase family DNA binding protein
MPRKPAAPPPLPKPHPLGTELYTTTEVAALLRCSVRHLLRAIEHGDLQAVKTGRHYVMTQEAIRQYWAHLAAQTPAPAAPMARGPRPQQGARPCSNAHRG